jgi:hypothetical protein
MSEWPDPTEIAAAWEEIHRALEEAMKEIRPQTLAFLGEHAHGIVGFKAHQVLSWHEYRGKLPEFGWFTHREHLRAARPQYISIACA